MTLLFVLVLAVMAAEWLVTRSLAHAGYGDLINRTDAEALIPEEVSREILQGIPQRSAAMTLFQQVSMSRKQQRMPVLSTLPTAYWLSAEGEKKQTTEQAWANKYLYAEELAVIVPIEEAVLSDSEFDIWGEVRPRLVTAFGKAIDQAVFFGTNKPSSWPNDILAGAVAASHTYNSESVADLDLADEIGGETGIMQLVEADGFDVNGFVGASVTKAKLRGLRDANGGLIFQPSLTAGTPATLYGQPLLYPMNGMFDASSALLFAGDWTQAILAIRQDMTFKLFDQGVIQDGSGAIVRNLMQQDQVALRAVMRVGYQVANYITDMNPTEATRYPFAVLTP